jgi:hypothetical protein
LNPNLAPVQGRHAVTPYGGARCGARAWRFVTVAPGRLWASCSPALRPVRGVPPLDWDRGRRVTPAPIASQEAWPEAEPWGPTSLWQEPWWDAERRARSALRAPHPARVRRLATRLSAFRFLAFFRSYISWLKAQIVRLPAATAGVLWRRSVRRAEKLVLEQQLGCEPHRENDPLRRHCRA